MQFGVLVLIAAAAGIITQHNMLSSHDMICGLSVIIANI
jgi:hypothetical protein